MRLNPIERARWWQPGKVWLVEATLTYRGETHHALQYFRDPRPIPGSPADWSEAMEYAFVHCVTIARRQVIEHAIRSEVARKVLEELDG